MDAEAINTIKLVLAVVGVVVTGIGFVWGIIWAINKNTSSKDTSINKGYNRNLETKIDLNKEMQEKELANQKDDIKESKERVTKLETSMGTMANSITQLSGTVENLVNVIGEDKEATRESTKALIDTNKGIREENIILRETNRIAQDRLNIEELKLDEKTKIFKEELKKVSENFIEQISDPQISKDLEKQGAQINHRIDRVRDDVKDIKDNVNNIKRDFDQLAALKDGACKEREVVKIIEKALDSNKGKEI